MELFDLHCDTLYKSLLLNRPLDDDCYDFKLNDFKESSGWIQCMAMWIPDDRDEIPAPYKNLPLIDFFIAGAEKLRQECLRLDIPYSDGKIRNKGFILTLENSSLLNNNIENIDILKRYNVKLATLTWNGHNCIGDGAGVENPKGITPFGRQVIEEFNRSNIVIDISHASDPLFYDVASINSGKIAASHSNSRVVCPNKRNLTDEQFCYIRDNGGLVGLNFHKYFLAEDGCPTADDIIRHVYHFLSLGGEDCLAIGSDFDGGEISPNIKNTSGVQGIYEKLIKSDIPDRVVNKIFYGNARKFFDIL